MAVFGQSLANNHHLKECAVAMNAPFLPYGKQDITEEDIAAVTDALKAPFLTTGPRVAEFEKALAGYVGVQHAIAVANGTAALHLCCLALDVGPGDTVLVPTMSFAASTNGAAYTGADVEFIDCHPDTGLITPQTFQAAAERAQARGKTAKAAVIVHLNGEHADMASIAKEAAVRNIHLIEDSCHALGTEFVDESNDVFRVGACRYSSLSTYSTHPVKTITTGEGGVITTKDEKLAKRLYALRNHGMVREPDGFVFEELAFDSKGKPNPWYYEIQNLGFNYRLTDIACALGTSQLARMPEFAKRRRELKILYDKKFETSNLPIQTIPTSPSTDPVRHLYPVLIDYDALEMERGDFCRAMQERGIGTQVHYIPTHLQPIYRGEHGNIPLPGAMEYYRRVISLPFFPRMEDADVDRVVDAISDVLANR